MAYRYLSGTTLIAEIRYMHYELGTSIYALLIFYCNSRYVPGTRTRRLLLWFLESPFWYTGRSMGCNKTVLVARLLCKWPVFWSVVSLPRKQPAQNLQMIDLTRTKPHNTFLRSWRDISGCCFHSWWLSVYELSCWHGLCLVGQAVVFSHSLVAFLWAEKKKMNIFRLAGDLSHLVAIIILLVKIWKTRSCAGIVCACVIWVEL